jgi:hypothetical protein
MPRHYNHLFAVSTLVLGALTSALLELQRTSKVAAHLHGERV